MNFTPLLYALAALGAVAFVAFSVPAQRGTPVATPSTAVAASPDVSAHAAASGADDHAATT